MKLTIRRNPTHTTDDGRFGVMFIDDVRFCPTLEHDSVKINAGLYNAELYFSPHNKRFVIRLIGVEDRTQIEIHIANWAKQLEGCIAVGDSRSDTQLINSKIAFDELMKKVITTNTPIQVEVLDA